MILNIEEKSKHTIEEGTLKENLVLLSMLHVFAVSSTLENCR